MWEVLILLFFFAFSGCDQQTEAPVKVSLSSVDRVETTQESNNSETLRIAIAAVISPEETFFLYKDLLNYISKKIGKKVDLIQRQTYEEVNNLVRDNELDLAFVCSGAYVDGHDQFSMELLVAPVVHGETVYYSYIIAPKESGARGLEDLRGKRFAFTDPLSNSGKLAPTYMLAQMNETAENFFSEYIFTYSHDKSIEMVAHALIDGAAVDSLIWEHMNRLTPEITSETKIIKKSDPYGIPPVVVPASIDTNLKKKLRNLFLNIHKDDEGKKIIDKLFIDKFVIMEDGKYDSIRKSRSLASDE
jgi:phosphonate transport system substrate-binding protein